MKTKDIILSQVKYLNKNIKTLFFISFPLIIFLGIFNHEETSEFIEVKFLEEENYLTSIFYLIIVLYFAYYFLRYVVNIHRLVILNDKESYFSFMKKFKVTFFYGFYLSILAIGFTIIIFFWSLTGPLIAELISFDLGPLFGIFLMIVYLFIAIFFFSCFALILPQVAVGEKTSLIKVFKTSKMMRKKIFLITLLIYVPLLIYSILTSGIVMFTSPYYAAIILNIIFTSVYAYGLALHVSCLSKIYLLWKEEENSETVVNNI